MVSDLQSEPDQQVERAHVSPRGRPTLPLVLRRLHWPTVAALALVILSLTIDLFGSFGLKDRGDTVSEYAAGMVQGPLYGGLNRQGQKDIAVVLVDKEAMAAFGETSWPMSYAALGQIVTNLVAYEPDAIMLDFYFEQPPVPRGNSEPDHEGLAALARQIRKAEEAGVAVYTGPISAGQDAFAPLRAVVSGRDADRIVQVSFRDGREFAYPLAVDKTPHPEMAATALYRRWASKHDVRPERALDALEGRTLALSWGFGMSRWGAAHAPVETRRSCDGSTPWLRLTSSLHLLWRLATPKLHEETEAEIYFACHYFDTVPAGWLGAPDQDIAAALQGRIVLVGADIGHLADRTPTPLAGKAPGVTAHAMALDNLITGGMDAVRYPADAWLGWDASDLVEIVLIVLGVGMIAAVRRRRRLAADVSLRLRDQIWIWGLVALAGVVIAAFCHWPLFKLLSASVTGLVALSVAENLRSVLKPAKPEEHSS
jgi:hypothetical protein